MVMAGGKSHGRVILSPDAIRRSLCNHTQELNESRGYAWVVSQKSCRGQKKIEVYSHLGFTGTAIWLIPALDMFVILLTNRVHPSRQDSRTIQEVRQEIIQRSIKLSRVGHHFAPGGQVARGMGPLPPATCHGPPATCAK
jgi:CubicO group peptidase (beta-lactamase class C family)